MDKKTLNDLIKSEKISADRIIAEEYEMLVLREIFDHKFSGKLVFKGGTALRLAYLSRRYSEDLDFSMIKKGTEKEFREMAFLISKKIPNTTLQIAREKYYCYFARFQFHDKNLSGAFGMKLEISKRPERLKEDKDFHLMNLLSPTVPFRLFGAVIDLSHVWSDKLHALRHRQKARDLYDKWFLSRELKKRFTYPKGKFSREELEEELHKFLPQPDWRLITSWLTTYEHKS